MNPLYRPETMGNHQLITPYCLRINGSTPKIQQVEAQTFFFGLNILRKDEEIGGLSALSQVPHTPADEAGV